MAVLRVNRDVFPVQLLLIRLYLPDVQLFHFDLRSFHNRTWYLRYPKWIHLYVIPTADGHRVVGEGL